MRVGASTAGRLSWYQSAWDDGSEYHAESRNEDKCYSVRARVGRDGMIMVKRVTM